MPSAYAAAKGAERQHRSDWGTILPENFKILRPHGENPWKLRGEKLKKALKKAFFRVARVGRKFTLVVLAKGDLWSPKDTVPKFETARAAKAWLCSQIEGLKLILAYKKALPSQ